MQSVTNLTAEHMRLWGKRRPDEATCDRIIELEKLTARTKAKTKREVNQKAIMAARIGYDDPNAIALLKSSVRDLQRRSLAA